MIIPSDSCFPEVTSVPGGCGLCVGRDTLHSQGHQTQGETRGVGLLFYVSYLGGKTSGVSISNTKRKHSHTLMFGPCVRTRLLISRSHPLSFIPSSACCHSVR